MRLLGNRNTAGSRTVHWHPEDAPTPMGLVLPGECGYPPRPSLGVARRWLEWHGLPQPGTCRPRRIREGIVRAVKGAIGSWGGIISSCRTRFGPGPASRTLIFATTCQVGPPLARWEEIHINLINSHKKCGYECGHTSAVKKTRVSKCTP